MKAKKKLISGWCMSGGHEGHKAFSPSGKPLRTCLNWRDCGCHCHAEVTAMYELAGIPREEPEQSHEYIEWVLEQRREFRSPDAIADGLRDGLSSPIGTSTLPNIESAPTGRPATPAGTLAAPRHVSEPLTATGRRTRGSLESEVLAVCVNFAAGVYEAEYCTPKMVAQEIGKTYAVEPPSTGAINAVWDRWEKLGFAKQDKKPSRFTAFTADVPNQAARLEKLKAQARSQKKRTRSEIKRGIRTA